MSDSVRPHRWQPTRLPHPWDSPGKNTGVGCHFLLQCMKVKSESEVAQSCLTLSKPHGPQPTRLLHPWDFPGKSIGVGYHCLLRLSCLLCVKMIVYTKQQVMCGARVKFQAHLVLRFRCLVQADSHWSSRTVGFPGVSAVRNPPAGAGDTGLISALGGSQCCEATETVGHSYRTCTLEPGSHNLWAHMPRLHVPSSPCPATREATAMRGLHSATGE